MLWLPHNKRGRSCCESFSRKLCRHLGKVLLIRYLRKTISTRTKSAKRNNQHKYIFGISLKASTVSRKQLRKYHSRDGLCQLTLGRDTTPWKPMFFGLPKRSLFVEEISREYVIFSGTYFQLLNSIRFDAFYLQSLVVHISWTEHLLAKKIR